MTLIAHGILALNRAIKERKSVYYDEKARRKLEKLEDVEDFIAEEMNLINRFAGGTLRRGKHPMALESMLIANAAVLAASPIIGVVAGAKALKDKIEEKKAEKKAEKEEEKKEKARIKKLEAEAESEKMEIDLALDLIEKADAVFARSPDARDTSAKTVGLISKYDDDYIQIVNLFTKDENRGDYVIFLYGKTLEDGNNTNVFFKNPETGNYEHMAEISSRLGKEKIWEAIQKRRKAVFDKKLRNSNTVKPVKDIKR